MEMSRPEDFSRVERVLIYGELPLTALMLTGIYAAVFWRPGAVVALCAVLATIGAHVVRGAIGYRRVMSRPWPRVTPLQDDDW